MKTNTAGAPLDNELNDRLLASLPLRSEIKLRERIVDYEIVEMAVLFRTGELTSLAVTNAYLDRIKLLNGEFEIYDENGGYNAFVRIDKEEAIKQATKADAWLQDRNKSRLPAPPLCGIPMGVKDSIGIEGRKSKNGTHAYNANVALKDATCVARLRAQGTVLIGHTICSEFSGDIIGQFAGNAWDITRVPGGSSQGSAVAPIARLAAGTLGEETAGSLVIPAAVNGASTIKPSPGFVSAAGVMPLRVGWDVVGPMARSIRDASLILSIIGGPDPENDPQTLSAPHPFPVLPIKPRTGELPLEGLKIGIPQSDWMDVPALPERPKPPMELYGLDHRQAFERFKSQLRQLGAKVVDCVGLDLTLEGNAPYLSSGPLYYIRDSKGEIIMPVFAPVATSYFAQVQTRQWLALLDFANSLDNEEDRDYLLSQIQPQWMHDLATQIPAEISLKAEHRRREQQRLYDQALKSEGIDFMMVLPVDDHVDPRFDEHYDRIPVKRTFFDAPNGLSWPMIVFPIGYGSTGLPTQMPISAAFWGRRFDEAALIQAAIDYQDRFPEYHNALPPEPMTGYRRPSRIPRVREVPDSCATDPVRILNSRMRP